MKKSLVFFMITALAIAATCTVSAQKSFKGIITYGLSYSGNIDAATAAQQPKLITLSILGNQAKTTYPLGPVTIEIIINGETKSSITLIDMMTEKQYFKQNQEELDKEIADKPVPVINYIDESKVIAGYTCKKAEYSTTDDEGTTTTLVVWYCSDLGGEACNYSGNFHGLKGVPLEWEVTQMEIITKFSASLVKKGKVKATDFLIPADYKELTAEEKDQMIKMFSGEE